MDKFAQRRGILNKLHEAFSPSGNAAENFFNPEFKKVMEALRKQDDTIRSIVAGEKIGDGDPGEDRTHLKQLLKSAKSNLARREYLLAASDLGRFHAKAFEVSKAIEGLNSNVDEVHEQFLFKHLDDKDNEKPEEYEKRMQQRKYLQNLRERLASERQAEIVKQAGIMDFFVNVGTQRGRALAMWEKRYPEKTKALKQATAVQIDASQKFLDLVLSQLKEMAKARASRNVDTYMNLAKKISDKYSAYDTGFKKFYNDQIKGFLEKMFPKEMAKEEAKLTDKVEFPSKETSPDSFSPGHEPTPPSSYGNPGSAKVDPESVESFSPAPASSYGDPASAKSHKPSSDIVSFEPTPPSSYDPGSGGGKHQIVVDPGANSVHNTMMSPGVQLPSNKAPKVDPLWNLSPITRSFSENPANSNNKAHNTLMGVAPPANPPVLNPTPSHSGVQPAMSREDIMRSIERQHGIVDEPVSYAHTSFYESLESLAGESPIILKKFISKYAASIQHTDPVTAIKLLKVASRIKG